MLRYAQTNDERGSLMNLYHLRYFVTLAHLEHSRHADDAAAFAAILCSQKSKYICETIEKGLYFLLESG